MARISTRNRGETGDVEWLPVSELQFDEEINRPVNKARVDSIAASFNPEWVGVLTVSERTNGRGVGYFIIDGQHRARALMKMGWADQRVPCHVRRDLTQSDEAGLFVGLNTTAKPSAYQRFAKSVLAGDPEAVAISDIVKSVGMSISDQQADGQINAVSTLEAVYRGGRRSGGQDPHALLTTLRIATNAWGKTANAVNGQIIHGLGLVVRRYGTKIDHDELLKKLAPFPGGPAGLLGRARGLRDIRGGSVANCVAAVIVDTYNKGKRSGAVADWWAKA